MTLAFFKSRCLVCWKGFEVPKLPDSSYGDQLYYDKRLKTFSYFSWFNNKEIEDNLAHFLSQKPDLQLSNNNTQGNTSVQIVALIGDGNNECVLGYNRCPRCGLKVTWVFDTKTAVREVQQLKFTKFLKLDKKQRDQYLYNRL